MLCPIINPSQLHQIDGLVQRVEDGIDGGRSSGGSGGVGGGSSTLIGRRLAGSDLSAQTDREDSPLHSKRSSMCLTRDID